MQALPPETFRERSRSCVKGYIGGGAARAAPQDPCQQAAVWSSVAERLGGRSCVGAARQERAVAALSRTAGSLAGSRLPNYPEQKQTFTV